MKPVQDLIEKETGKKFEVEKAISLFKIKLFEDIERKFKSNWKDCQINESLMQLEISKATTIDNEKKWRPMNEPVEEQVRPIVVNRLLRQKKLLQHSVDHQNTLIAELILRNEECRRLLRAQVEKREQIISQIESDRNSLKKVEVQLQQINQILN
jgi:hypothetical protein